MPPASQWPNLVSPRAVGIGRADGALCIPRREGEQSPSAHIACVISTSCDVASWARDNINILPDSWYVEVPLRIKVQEVGSCSSKQQQSGYTSAWLHPYVRGTCLFTTTCLRQQMALQSQDATWYQRRTMACNIQSVCMARVIDSGQMMAV